jgi:hypothetical protein
MDQAGLNEALKVAISANLGWGFELYDLLTYIYVAPYIAPLFFPSKSYIASLLETLLILVLGILLGLLVQYFGVILVIGWVERSRGLLYYWVWVWSPWL